MLDALRRSSRPSRLWRLSPLRSWCPTSRTSGARLGQYYFIVAMVMMALGLNIVMGYAGQLFLGPTALFSAGGYAAAVSCAGAHMATGPPGDVRGVRHHRACHRRRLGVADGPNQRFVLRVADALHRHRSARNGQSDQCSGRDERNRPHRGPGFRAGPHRHDPVLHRSRHDHRPLLSELGINRSRLGRRFSAIRHGDEASALGVAPASTKLVAFLIGSVPCALAGAYFVYSQQFITPSSVSPTLSIYIIAGVIIGGAGTISGPIIGTSLILGFQQLVSGLATYAGIASGILLIVVAIAAPEGLVGLLRQGVIGMAWAKFTERNRRQPITEHVPGADDSHQAAMTRLLGNPLTPAASLVVRGSNGDSPRSLRSTG